MSFLTLILSKNIEITNPIQLKLPLLPINKTKQKKKHSHIQIKFSLCACHAFHISPSNQFCMNTADLARIGPIKAMKYCPM